MNNTLSHLKNVQKLKSDIATGEDNFAAWAFKLRQIFKVCESEASFEAFVPDESGQGYKKVSVLKDSQCARCLLDSPEEEIPLTIGEATGEQMEQRNLAHAITVNTTDEEVQEQHRAYQSRHEGQTVESSLGAEQTTVAAS